MELLADDARERVERALRAGTAGAGVDGHPESLFLLQDLRNGAASELFVTAAGSAPRDLGRRGRVLRGGRQSPALDAHNALLGSHAAHAREGVCVTPLHTSSIQGTTLAATTILPVPFHRREPSGL